MCYRICARGLSATIRYHNRYKCFPVMYHILKKDWFYPLSLISVLSFPLQGKQTQKRRNLCCQSYFSDWHCDSVHRWLLCYGMQRSHPQINLFGVLHIKKLICCKTISLHYVSPRWVRSMEAWWELFREPWWDPVLMSGLRGQRWKIAI